MKKSLIKNNLKAIQKTRRRFISILVMAFLGVGFYAGLVASSPDMLDSLDKYADKNKMFDINIISTLGITDEDIDELKKIDGVEGVHGVQTKDSIVRFDEKERVCKVIEYNENVNLPTVVAGRMIENPEECLLDERYSLEDDLEKYIGQTIELVNDDKDEDDNDIFTVKQFKVVGIVNSPTYISSERGTTSLGSGSIEFYIYVGEDIINMDCFTEANILIKGAREEETNSNEYLKLVNSVNSKVEEIKTKREDARYNKIVDDANKKIEDAQKEYNEKKDDVNKELKDAEKKINDAKKDIESGENKIQNGEKEIAKQESDLKNQMKKANEELQASKIQIEQSAPFLGEEQTKVALAQIDAKEKELEKTKKEAEKKINNAKAELKKNKEKIENAKKELEKNEKEYKKSKKEAEEKLEDAQKEIDDARDEIKKIEKPTWYIQDRLDNTGYTNIFDAIKTMSNISKIFPIIFYLVAVLISLTSMTRMIEEERIEIGTLKALGYTNLQIISKYILYAFLACVIGGVLGMTVGFYLLPSIVWSLYSLLYTIPEFYITYRVQSGLMGIIIAFICIGGATIFVAYKELKQYPSVLMRPKPPKNGKRIFLERVSLIWKRMNFSQKVTARNIFRYKKRALMTIIGIAGCTGLMLTGFGIRDSVVDIPNAQFGNDAIFKYEENVSLINTKGLNELEDYLNSNENIENYSKMYATGGTLKDGKKEFKATIFVAENVDEIKNVISIRNIEDKQDFTLTENGIVITDKIADTFKIKPGDEVTLLDSDDVEYRFKVDAIAENHVSHYVYMSKEFFEKNMGEYETNMIFINTINADEDMQYSISEKILDFEGVAAVSVMSTLIKTVEDMLNTMNYVVIVLIVSSALLAFVVLYNLANINIGERQREIATLKVLGFEDREVDNYINKENIIFTCIGVVLGLVFGIFMTNAIIASIEIDSLRFIKNIFPLSYVYSSVITITFSLIVNFIIHFILKKIDMIESLKSVE